MPEPLTPIRHADRPSVTFPGGALYRTIVGDDTGRGIPLRTGIQESPPGYETRPHSHPYPEILTVLAGAGEAWFVDDGERVPLEPGVTIVFPEGRVHAFRASGAAPLVTLGIHASVERIVHYHEPQASQP